MFHKITCNILLLFIFDTAFAAENIRILGLFRDAALVAIDGKQELLRVGDKATDGILLVSANSNAAVLEIDGARDTYTLNDVISSNFTAPTGQNTVTVAPDDQGMYWVNGSINGYQVEFVIDTGASLISMNKHQAIRMGIDYKSRGTKAITSTASGTADIYVIELVRVKVGDIQLQDIQAAVHDSDFPQAILLGNSFLRRINMRREGGLLLLYNR
jgi:aspartyl protease family protein